MSADISSKLPVRVRGRPFEKGRSGNPAGRRPGSRNKATLAAAALLAGEAEALTRKAVEMALDGDPTAMRLCMERVLPPCRAHRRVQAAGDRGHPHRGDERAVSRRRRPGDGCGHLGARPGRDHAG